jgi:hypothetical protein
MRIDIRHGGQHLSEVERHFAQAHYPKYQLVACFADEANRDKWIDTQEKLGHKAGKLEENQARYRVENNIAAPIACYLQTRSNCPLSVDANIVYENKMAYWMSVHAKKQFAFDGEYIKSSFPLRVTPKSEVEENKFTLTK